MKRLRTGVLFLAALAAGCAAVKPVGPSNEQRITEITTDATPIADPVVFAAESPAMTGTFAADTIPSPLNWSSSHGHGSNALRHHSGFAWHPAGVTSGLGVRTQTSFGGGFGPSRGCRRGAGSGR